MECPGKTSVTACPNAAMPCTEHASAPSKLAGRTGSADNCVQVWDHGGNGCVRYSAATVGLPVMGYVAENRVIQAALGQTLRSRRSVVDYVSPVNPPPLSLLTCGQAASSSAAYAILHVAAHHLPGVLIPEPMLAGLVADSDLASICARLAFRCSLTACLDSDAPMLPSTWKVAVAYLSKCNLSAYSTLSTPGLPHRHAEQ